MFVYPQNAYVKILTPNLIVLGGGVWGRQLDHKYGILKSGIVRDRRWISLKLSLSFLFTFSVLYHMRICWEDNICKPGGGHPSYTMSVSILILNFPSSRTVRDKCLLFNPPSLWRFLTAAQAKLELEESAQGLMVPSGRAGMWSYVGINLNRNKAERNKERGKEG